jgi:NTP pyrophosphatase (non-canonical NTP hydrolase)
LNKKEQELNELLGLLVEECAEVIQSISKANRFGFDNIYEGVSNVDHFRQEVGDVISLVIILTKKHPDILNDTVLDEAVKKKIKRLKRRVKSLKNFTLEEPEESK